MFGLTVFMSVMYLYIFLFNESKLYRLIRMDYALWA